jgi:hypothetical protein
LADQRPSPSRQHQRVSRRRPATARTYSAHPGWRGALIWGSLRHELGSAPTDMAWRRYRSLLHPKSGTFSDVRDACRGFGGFQKF